MHWRRGRLTHFVETHRGRWDLVMAVLTIVYVALAFHEDAASRLGEYLIWGLAILFLLEFGARCYDAPNRSAYFRTHWLDLVTAVPVPGIPGVRVLRLIRLLRLIKVGIKLREYLVRRGWDDAAMIWPTLILFWLVSAFALWLVEHDAPGSSITTFGDAMSAAFLTASTLGFGRHLTPVTQDGQMISAAIVFLALGIWGFASNQIAQLWLHSNRQRPATRPDTIERELREIREQLSTLTATLATATDPHRATEGIALEPAQA